MTRAVCPAPAALEPMPPHPDTPDTSINNAGDKTFMITKLNDEFIINSILNNVLDIIEK